MGVGIGRQLDQFGATVFDFGGLFRSLGAQLLGDAPTLVASFYFAPLQLFSGILELCLLRFQLLTLLFQLGGTLALGGGDIIEFALPLFQLQLELLEFRTAGLVRRAVLLQFSASLLQFRCAGFECGEVGFQCLASLVDLRGFVL